MTKLFESTFVRQPSQSPIHKAQLDGYRIGFDEGVRTGRAEALRKLIFATLDSGRPEVRDWIVQFARDEDIELYGDIPTA